MADEYRASRKWSLEEIDELLQDSGMLPREDNTPEEVEEVAPTPKTAPFNPRPARNDKIKHNIKKDTVEKSEGSAEPQVYGSFVSEKYRDKFFNKPIQNLQKTAEHTIVPPEEQKFERGGFVKKQSNFAATSDFVPVPNLVPDDKVSVDVGGKTVVFDDTVHQKTIALRSLAVTDGDAHDIELPVEEEDTQLSFEGFHTSEVEVVDEQQVEEELIKKRKEKVSSFAISGDITEQRASDDSKLYGTDEYRTVDDKFKVKYYLKKRKTAVLAGAAVAFLSAAVLLVLSLTVKGSSEKETVSVILSLVLTALAAGVNYQFVLDGLMSFKGFRFNRNTGCFIAISASVIQSIVLLSTDAPFETGVSLFGASAVFALGLNMAGEYLELSRIAGNFEYICEKEDIYTINHIEKEGTAFEIGRGLLLDAPSVIASQKTLFPRRFIELSGRYYPSDDLSKKLIPLGVGAGVLVGVITLLISKDIRSAVTAFCAAICVSVPYFSCLADSLVITKLSKKLLGENAMISGWEAYKMCEESNAVALDSKDVFDENGGNVYGIHPFYDIGIDEAIIYTATLAIASGGPLGNLFKRVIVGETSLLPPVDTLAYEDKLGLSAWIFNRRVLVGNSDLLKNHNVEIPDTALINKHLKEGRYPLYLAIDGKAAAVFIISYDTNEENAPLLRKIEANSISLLLRSDDANITDEMVASKLKIHQSGVKVLSAVSGDVYKTYVKETTTASDAVLVHDGSARSFLKAVEGALSLGGVRRVMGTLQICACGIGVALVAVLSFVSGLQSLSCFSVLMLQGIFTALSSFCARGIKNN